MEDGGLPCYVVYSPLCVIGERVSLSRAIGIVRYLFHLFDTVLVGSKVFIERACGAHIGVLEHQEESRSPPTLRVR